MPDPTTGMTPDQMMYMMALMGGNQGGNFSPTSSGVGAAGQAMSPLIRMLMMQRMMGNQGGGATPWDPSQHITPPTPGQQYPGGFTAPASDTGWLGPDRGGPPPAFYQGNSPAASPMAMPPAPASPPAPVANLSGMGPPTGQAMGTLPSFQGLYSGNAVGSYAPVMGFGGPGY